MDHIAHNVSTLGRGIGALIVYFIPTMVAVARLMAAIC